MCRNGKPVTVLRVIIARCSDSIPAHVLVRVLVLPVRILHTSLLATYIVVLIFLCTCRGGYRVSKREG